MIFNTPFLEGLNVKFSDVGFLIKLCLHHNSIQSRDYEFSYVSINPFVCTIASACNVEPRPTVCTVNFERSTSGLFFLYSSGTLPPQFNCQSYIATYIYIVISINRDAVWWNKGNLLTGFHYLEIINTRKWVVTWNYRLLNDLSLKIFRIFYYSFNKILFYYIL